MDDHSKKDITVIDIPEAVGVFNNFDDLQRAFYDLRSVGFSRYDISLLAKQEVLETTLGKAYWRAPDLADNPQAPRAAFVSEEAMGELEGMVAGGFFFVGSMIAMAALLTPASTVAASIAAVAIGGSPGAAIGTLLARRAGKTHREYYANQLAHGGILLWVRVSDKVKEDLAIQILMGHSGHHVHVHAWSE